MQFEEKVLINASLEKVFSLYANVAGWSSWDPDVKSSSVSGAFISGAMGVLEPSSGPKAKIIFTEVMLNQSFTVESKLPLCVTRFEHELSSEGNQTRALHRVSFVGFLSPLFGRLIGSQIRQGLPRTLEGLKRAAEQ